MKYFAGVGSRNTPQGVQDMMKAIARQLADSGVGLRSGGAQGADAAFESGCTPNECQIFLPWPKYNGNKSQRFDIPPLAFEIAESVYIHNWNQKTQAVQKLMARNVQQVLGPTLTKGDESLFVLCWTQDGCECDEERQRHTGGTGQAISVASSFDIPVVNMYNDNWKLKLTKLMEDI